MKKWIEKDGKHVLVVGIYENEVEILELREDSIAELQNILEILEE